ncbi:MAG: OmpA family protein [Deltaproteobacteria bacterium]|nr:OmpA family protein [Deltaproteobacteria bacterium]
MLPVLVLAGIAGCAHRTSSAPDLVYQLDREVIALRERLDRCQAQVLACGAPQQPARIYAELVQVLPPGQVTLSREGATTLVTIPHDVLFADGDPRLRAESRMLLDLLATALQLHPDQAVVVEGHSDDTGAPPALRRTYPTPWRYSALLAASVAEILVDYFEVDARRVSVAALGAVQPVSDNDTPEGRRANRRIVVRILPPPPGGDDP